MRIDFIRHTPATDSLILIFAGWSTDPSLYRDVEIQGWDVVVVYDYSDLSIDLTLLDRYSTIWLFAWSLGVRIAAATLPEDKITAAYAINGTLSPVDDNFGIPTSIYNGTADNLTPVNLKKFRRRMASDGATFRTHLERDFSDEDTESLRHQLYLIRDLVTPAHQLPWRRAYISDNDKIFPPDNMVRSWNSLGVETRTVSGAHYIPMQQIVRASLPDMAKVADRFAKALATYDDNASAQRIIAEHLSSLLPELPFKKHGKILEIGPGTGLFSRMYAEIIEPDEIDFVDIVDIPQIGIASKENYHTADAERWIRKCDRHYDCILSASTIQWFSNIPDFLSNCRRLLNPGGIIALSAFLPGNLGELNEHRPSPIHYHDVETYRKWMEKYFTDVKITTGSITLDFASPRELMLHLRNTGVGGSAPSPRISPASLRSIRAITYRPVYITAFCPAH